MGKSYWWLAVYGPSSVEISPLALEPETFMALPAPLLMLGFPGREEAEAGQRLLLAQNPDQVKAKMDEWSARCRDGGDMIYDRPENPVKLSPGDNTGWLVDETQNL